MVQLNWRSLLSCCCCCGDNPRPRRIGSGRLEAPGSRIHPYNGGAQPPPGQWAIIEQSGDSLADVGVALEPEAPDSFRRQEEQVAAALVWGAAGRQGSAVPIREPALPPLGLEPPPLVLSSASSRSATSYSVPATPLVPESPLVAQGFQESAVELTDSQLRHLRALARGFGRGRVLEELGANRGYLPFYSAVCQSDGLFALDLVQVDRHTMELKKVEPQAHSAVPENSLDSRFRTNLVVGLTEHGGLAVRLSKLWTQKANVESGHPDLLRGLKQVLFAGQIDFEWITNATPSAAAKLSDEQIGVVASVSSGSGDKGPAATPLAEDQGASPQAGANNASASGGAVQLSEQSRRFIKVLSYDRLSGTFLFEAGEASLFHAAATELGLFHRHHYWGLRVDDTESLKNRLAPSQCTYASGDV